MVRYFRLCMLILSIFFTATCALANPSEDSEIYLSRVSEFQDGIRYRIQDVFLKAIKESTHLSEETRENIRAVTEEYLATLLSKIDSYKEYYTKRYMSYSRDPKVKQMTLMLEENIKLASEDAFYNFVEILQLSKTEVTDKVSKQIAEKIGRIRTLTEMLKANKKISEPLGRTLLKVAPMSKGFFRLLMSMLPKMLFNANITDTLKSVKTDLFSRQKTDPEIVFLDRSRKQVSSFQPLPQDAAIVLSMNHEHPALDGLSMLMLSRLFGIDESYLLTTKTAWPHIPLFEKVGITHKDPKIFFIQDENLKSRILTALSSHRGKRVALGIFPEGQLPFWNTQFPLHSHFGTFNYARSAAHLMSGQRPVYYVQIMGNFMRSLTSKEGEPLRIEIIEPELVPTDPVGPRDAWVEEKRALFEKEANSSLRRGQMINFESPQKIPNGKIYLASPVRPRPKQLCLSVFSSI